MASIIKRTYKVRTADGRTVTKVCEHYTIQYRNAAGKIKRVKGYKDKGATKQLAARLELALARGEEGLVDPYKPHKARALREHVTEYVVDLRAAGRSAKYANNAERRLRILVSECGWNALNDVEPTSFLKWRAARRPVKRKGTRRDLDGTSAETLNQYLETARTFLNWCLRTGRCAANRLTGVDKVEGEKVRVRRALSDEQVTKLLQVAPAGSAIVYRVGLAIGLRRSELEQLLWGDLRLVATRPFVSLRAAATKARRADKVFMPATLAEELRKLRPDENAGGADGDRVFPAVPDLEQWKADLMAAGIPYRDAMGRQADFHAGCRKTLCTRMHRAGVPLAAAMRVMRHVDARLTMVDYADDEQIVAEAAVLPELVAPPPAGGGQQRAADAAG